MSVFSNIKRVLIGKPIHRAKAHHERLPKVFGLPVFASDALSSVAYASEEIMLVLMLAGSAALSMVFGVSLWLGVLMIIIGFSYYQTIHAYPSGGGTYLVSTENLGSGAGRVAGAALLIDYVLTVSVSVSAGLAAIVSLLPSAQPYMVPIGCAAILLLTIANLRGAKESGMLFAIPTYTFVICILIIVGTGIVKGLSHPHIPASPPIPPEGFHQINALLLLRAFAASCTALTGTEAIADGVQAFKAPEAKNAAQTLVMMIVMLLVMFIGLSYIAMHEGLSPIPPGTEGFQTVLAQITEALFGRGWFYTLVLIATAAILFLAANTAYADFPRLSSFIAKDGYLPRQLMSVGDRMVFQNGVVILGIVAMLLIVIYKADTHSLIPLYAMGVFISFTMSQAGMTVKWWRLSLSKGTSPWSNWKLYVAGFGSLVTLSVTGVLFVTKFSEGSWLIAVMLAIMLFIFARIRNHYNYLSSELSVGSTDAVPKLNTTALLLVPRLHRGILHAIAYAQTLTHDVRALHVTLDPQSVDHVKKDWIKFGSDIPLVILDSPYRSLVEPVIEYVDQALAEDPNAMITVIVPQAVPKRWWHGILHNNAAVPLKLALASRKNVVITNVRYFLK